MSGTSFSYPFSSPFGSGFTFVPPSGGLPLGSLNPTAPSPASNGVDRLLDPITRDYVRTENGEWAETADNRTIVLIALSVEYGRSPFNPEHGTTIAEHIRQGVGFTASLVQAETSRVGRLLQTAGVLSDLTVEVRDAQGNELKDADGRLAVKATWQDLSSGSPVAQTFTTR